MSERIPEGWTKMQLHELLTVPRKEREIKPEIFELLTVKLHGQGIVRSGKFPKPTPNGRPYFKRFTGELLIGRQNLHNGGLGLVTKETSGLIASNAISSFVNRASSDLNFIHQLLSTEGFKNQIDTLSSGTGQKETSEKQILSCGVVVPPLHEQKKIASILTSVDEVIENTQKQIDKLQDLKKATMNELLTKGIGHTEFKDSELGRIPKSWADDRFEQFMTLQRGNDLPVQERKEGNVPIYGSNGIVGFHDDYVISREGVITGRSGSIGDVHYSEERCWPLNTTLYVKDFHGNFPKYVAYFLQFFDLKKFASGTGVPTLNRNDIHSQYIAFPPPEEQMKICKILTQLDKTISQKTEELRLTQSLKKSLMQDLLTGKVRVKVN